ncbi:MAG: hypothetical protein JEZ04_14970 [Spirochaetales bacterium]|nr:hypothetical protein [Spirochaetales bacterium]
MKADKLIILCLAALVFSGCPLNAPPSAEEGAVNYYSKEIETSVYVDPDDAFLEPIEQRIYDEQGRLTAISKHTYSYLNEASPSEYPVYKISRTDVYEVSSDGTETKVEYYLYTYLRDSYQWVDDDGVTQDAVDYVLLTGKSYTADDTLRLYYDVVYDAPDAANYDVYLSITDRENAGGTITALQESTYVLHGDGVKRFRTEKYYDLDSSDTLKLSKEFATWYDAAEPYDYLYDLYHSFRSDDTGADEEFYYFTRYSRNGSGYIYEQADYDYDWENALVSATPLIRDVDKSFTVPFAYDIEFLMIKDKATVLTTEYDSLGNIILDERTLNGELNEYTRYTYNRASELTDQLRYTRGGSLLHDRTTIRFTEEYREDVYHRLKETCVYKYYDYNSSPESQEARGLIRSADSFTGKSDEEIRQAMYEKMNKHYR